MKRRSAQKTKTAGRRAVEMTGLWKPWKAKSRLPPVSTSPWESRQGQARFPHFHSSGDEADGKVENQKQVSHFPTAISLSQNKKPGTAGRASPSARRLALRATSRVKE
jgi:hypothetical protein